MLLLTPPGVYAPQGDTWLLAEALHEARLPAGGRALDVGTGSGVLALAAIRAGAGSVTGIDVSWRAVVTARMNAMLHRAPVRVLRRDLRDLVVERPFDVVIANPPYVPCREPAPPRRGAARAWDSGLDGRALLDPLCARAPELLTPKGTLLLVHSALSGVDRTLAALRDSGMVSAVVARLRQPFGPVLRTRRRWLESVGLIARGEREEELVVIRADRT